MELYKIINSIKDNVKIGKQELLIEHNKLERNGSSLKEIELLIKNQDDILDKINNLADLILLKSLS